MPEAPPEKHVAVISNGARHALGRSVAEALRAAGDEVVLGDADGLERARTWAREVGRGHPAVARLVLLDPDLETAAVVAASLLPALLAAGSPSYGGAARVVVAGRLSQLGRTRTENLQLVRALHALLKDASCSRRVQVVGALGAAAILRAATAESVRGGGCLAPGGPWARFGAPAPGELPASVGDTKRCLRRLDEACRKSGASFAALEDEASRLEQKRRELAAGPRRISAVVRARNEEEFLYPAVKSIVHLVDEVLIVDNRSEDSTPEIAKRLAAEHPGVVRALDYPYRIARQGSEQREATLGRGDLRPMHDYLNWAIEQCAHPFVLKWDADMVALPALERWLARWRESEKLVLAIYGSNVHPQGRHLAAARVGDAAVLEAQLDGPGLPEWATRLTYDSVEPRLFPSWEARFDGSWGWVEAHVSPFFFGTQRRRTRLEPDESCFLHLKFCKADPFGYYTPDLAKVIRENLIPGPALSDEEAATLDRWGLAPGGDS